MLRILGALDIAFGLLGGLSLVSTWIAVHQRGFPYDPRFPYQLRAFLVMSPLEALFVACHFPVGVCVARLRRRGRWMTNLLLGSQFVWVYGWALAALITTMAGKSWALVGQSMAAVSGVGGMGTGLETIVAYPIWGIILTNVAYRKLYPLAAGGK
jgi:hypothetical protein